MFGTQQDATVYIQTALLFSKPNGGESDSENSVRNGNNHIQLSCSYLTGPTLGQLQFEYPIELPYINKSYMAT